jgi:hypothetical protein
MYSREDGKVCKRRKPNGIGCINVAKWLLRRSRRSAFGMPQGSFQHRSPGFQIQFLRGHLSVQTTERSRLHTADFIGGKRSCRNRSEALWPLRKACPRYTPRSPREGKHYAGHTFAKSHKLSRLALQELLTFVLKITLSSKK